MRLVYQNFKPKFHIRLILLYPIDRICILSFTQSPLRGFVFPNAESGLIL